MSARGDLNEMNVVATVQKNKREEIRIGLDEYMGHNVCNMRIFFTGKDGDVSPTKKGLTIAADKLPQFIEACQKAQSLAEERGWVSKAA